jgi:hypothetical protein
MTPQYVVAPNGQIVVAGQAPRVSVADIGQAWVANLTGGTASTPGEFNPSTGGASLSAYQNNPPTEMYKNFEALRPEEKNFWALMAANYHSSSTPEAQYAKFAEIAVQQGAATGVWANPLGIAMRHARDMNYDMRNVYVPDDRAAMALRRGTAQTEQGAYDPEFQGFVAPEDTGSTGSYYGGGGGGGYGGGGGGATSERIDLASPTQAQALLTQFMQSAVGRNPRANEVSKFLELLQDYQRNNPTVVSAEGSTVTQSGGIDAGVVAQEFVETLPDYTEAQADRYYRSFMSALLGGG